MTYQIADELSTDIVDHEISILQGMPDLTPEETRLDPVKFTKSEIRELIRVNTKNTLFYQKWLDLISRVVPEDVDHKIILLRSLHQRRLDECIAIVAALQSDPAN